MTTYTGNAAPSDRAVELRLDKVRVSFGGVVALDEVSMVLKGPGIVGIVGPNGSGKSTTLGVLSGLVRPSSGRVFLNDRDMTGRSALKFARAGVGRSFQAVRLVPNLTIHDNLLIGLGRVTPRARSEVSSLADAMGLGAYLRRWPSEVPAGIQRLVQVAAVAATKPSVVLLDEPAAGLTDAECAELARVVRNCAATALTVVVEHNMQLMYELADRVVALVNGRVAVEGPVKTVWDDEVFRSAYLGIDGATEAAATPGVE